MKNLITTVFATVLAFNISFAQRLTAIEQTRNSEFTEFSFNQIIGSFHNVLYVNDFVKGDLYLKGFENESMEPLFNNRIGFFNSEEQDFRYLDLVMTNQGPIILGYKIANDFKKISFYTQEINTKGETAEKATEIINFPYSKETSYQKIKITTSKDLSKVGLSFFRKTANQKYFLADIIVLDLEKNTIAKSDMKVTQKAAVSNSTDFEFSIFVRNTGEFISIFEENIYDLNPDHIHIIQSYTFKTDGKLVAELDLNIEEGEFFKPYFSENSFKKGFKVTGFFTARESNKKSGFGFQGVASIFFSDEDHQQEMEITSPFTEVLLSGKLKIDNENSGGLNRTYSIDKVGLLATGQSYLACSQKIEETAKEYSIVNLSNILLVSYGRKKELNFETVIERSLIPVYVRSSNMSAYFISYPKRSLNASNYIIKTDHKNIYILFKDFEIKSLTKGNETLKFNTKLIGKGINDAREDLRIVKDVYSDDQFLFYLKSYSLLHSERFEEK